MSSSLDDLTRPTSSTGEPWSLDAYFDYQPSPKLARCCVSRSDTSLQAGFDVASQLAELVVQQLREARSAVGRGDLELCAQSLSRIQETSDALAVETKRLVADPNPLARRQRSRFRATAFLDALEAAYFHLTNFRPGPPPVVRLVAIWDLLTLRPGTRTEYTKADFGSDLTLLDESGVTMTGAGRTIRFSASSGTRTDGVLTTIGRDGRPHIYWGVSFS